MDLGRDHLVNGIVDRTMAFDAREPFESLGYDRHVEMPAAGTRTGVPGVACAIIFDLDAAGFEVLAQQYFDSARSIHDAEVGQRGCTSQGAPGCADLPPGIQGV